MPERPDRQSWLRPLGIGSEFAVILIGGCAAGLWFDRAFGVGPWGALTGALLGLVAGLYNFLRVSIRSFRSVNRPPEVSDDEEST